MDLKILGICGAQGALLFPIKKYLIGNVEPRAVFHDPKEHQWNLNFPNIPFERTLNKFLKSKVDVIIGSPSCGHSSIFSYSRRKTLGKPREDKCLSLYLSSVKTFKPKIFIMENLPKLMDLIPIEEWESNLKDYKLIVHCHSVFDFGNSQKSRKRLLLVGIRKDLNNKVYQNFSNIYSVRKKNDPYYHFLVKDLPNLIIKSQNYRENDDRKMAMYKYWDKSKTTLTVAEIRKLWTGKFKNEYKWPMKTQKMRTLPGVYRNRPNTCPLTVRPSSRQFMPDGNPIGLDEFRVIMGFPKRFKIYWDESRRVYWLNKGRNTLTKGSVYEMGLWIKHALRASKSYLY